MLCLSFIYEVFEKANLTFSSKTAVYEALEHIIGYLAQRKASYFGLDTLSHHLSFVTLAGFIIPISATN